jgi:hypothetical protein
MSAPEKSVRARRAKSRPKSARTSIAKLPDLSEIVYALSDAGALVTVASSAVMDGGGGPEATVLRLGVDALEKAMDQLERAELKFAAFRKRHGGTP